MEHSTCNDVLFAHLINLLPCRYVPGFASEFVFFEGDIITEQSPVHYYNTLGVNSKKFSVELTVKSEAGCSDSVLKDEIIGVRSRNGLYSTLVNIGHQSGSLRNT
jgi:hypothetical protein